MPRHPFMQIYQPPDLSPDYMPSSSSDDEEEEGERQQQEQEYGERKQQRRRGGGGGGGGGKTRSCDVTGQCKLCLDLFTVTLFIAQGRLHVVETPRLAWKRGNANDKRADRLLHRHRYGTLPDGLVVLYGSTDILTDYFSLSPPPTESDLAR